MTVSATRLLLNGSSVFVSASIPDSRRWHGDFDPLAVTDAVVAVARAVLAGGGRLVTAAHPTIAPLLLYVAAEQPPSSEPLVVVYQSDAFRDVLPDATLRFEEQGIGTVIHTAAAEGEPPDPSKAPKSLELMRRQLLASEPLAAGIFIGGMSGIPREHALFRSVRPDAPTYALGRPGGEASQLVGSSPAHLRELLATSDLYPAVARAVVADIAERMLGTREA